MQMTLWTIWLIPLWALGDYLSEVKAHAVCSLRVFTRLCPSMSDDWPSLGDAP